MRDQVSKVDKLQSEVFSQRRYHEIANCPDDTLAQLLKRQRWGQILLRGCAIVSTPMLIGMLFYIGTNYAPHEPLPLWLACALFVSINVATPSCMSLLLVSCLRAKQTRGRWIVFRDGILYRYGKDPHRYVPFSSIRAIDVEKPRSEFSCVVLQTDTFPLHISERAGINKHETKFLPFLNFIVPRLQRYEQSIAGFSKLVELQRTLRRRTVSRGNQDLNRYSDWTVVVAYSLPLMILVPTYQFICVLPYPTIWWGIIPVCFVAVGLGMIINRFFEKWKGRKIDSLIESLQDARTSYTVAM